MIQIINPEHKAVLFDLETWSDNPFIHRDARRDAKRSQPLRSILWLCGVLTIFCFSELWGLNRLHIAHLDHIWVIGGDPITALVAVFCGIHMLFIIGSVQKLTLRMIASEISQNTFPSLILLPISPFQMVLQSCCYPWLAGMRMALVLLPVYIFFVGLGGLSWLDLWMLYLVFALVSFSVPRWNKPALGDSSGQTPEVGSQQIGVLLRQNIQSSQPAGGVPVFGQWLSTAMMVPFLAVPLTGSMQGISGLARYVPESLLNISLLSFLSWPLMAARGFITPFDWFGHPVYPVVFCLIFFVLSRYCQIVKVVEYLQSGRYSDLSDQNTYHDRQNLEGLIKLGSALVLIGYLWKWGVADGGLRFISASQVGPLAGQEGMLLLILGVTMWQRCLSRAGSLGTWLRESSLQGRKSVLKQVSFKSALRYLLLPIVSGVLLYTICCLFAISAPFPGGFGILCLKVILIGLAGMLLHFGSKIALGSILSLLGYLFLPAVVMRPQQFHMLGYFSPALGMISLANQNLFHASQILSPGDFWWKWVVYPAVPGLLLAVAGIVIASRSVRSQTAKISPILRDPTQVGSEVYLDIQTSETAAASKEDTPIGLQIIHTIQKLSDNAVLCKQLRTGLRGKLSAHAMQKSLLVFAGITAAAWLFVPQLPIVFGSSLANMLYGSTFSFRYGSSHDIAGGVMGTWYIGGLFTAGISSLAILPLVFAVEREKSTLDFLLTTPMSSASIVFGKASGLFITAGLGTWIISLWTMILSISFMTLIDPMRLLLGWLIMFGVTLLIVCTIGLFAIAVASIMPKLITIRGSAVFNMFVIYGFMFGPQVLRAMNFQYLPFQDWTPSQIAAAVTIVLITLDSLFLLLSIWGVRRMRRADISFGITSRIS